MSAQLEKNCTSSFLKSLKAQGVRFAYKIPDMPRTARFTPTKPGDVIATLPPIGRSVLIEFKASRKIEALGSQLRESQLTGLEANFQDGGLSLVIYFAKGPAGKWGFVVAPWADYGERFLSKESIKAKELNELDWTWASLSPLKGAEVWDLTNFVRDARNGLHG